jgi:SAM-dependent methyltransferase
MRVMAVNQAPNYRSINESKANFDQIYTQPDPRDYYRVLYGLDYIIPDLARQSFRNIISALERSRGRRIKVLDLGCSYGNNGALIRFPLDLARLAQRYRDLEGEGLSPEELIRLDRSYFGSWPQGEIEIVGMDISKPAISYAQRVGLIDDGMAVNLETEPLTPACREMLKGVDLIISTGCIGYVTERSFDKLLTAIGEPAPWIASFVLRMFPYGRIAGLFDAAGLVTQRLNGVTFIQRRFHSEEECSDVLSKLEAQGIGTEGKEAEGFLQAKFFLSRPIDETDAGELEDLVNITSGAERQFGRRFRRGSDDVIRFGL